MFQDLRKKAGGEPAPETPTAPAAPKPADPPKAEVPEAPETPETPETPEAPETPKPGEKPTTPDPKKEKANPWKLYEHSKTRIAALEQENSQLKEKLVPEADRETFLKRLNEAEGRAKALEDEIRFVNYSKSEEFKTKYEAPYEKAWKVAMAELSEIGILDPQTNQQRPVEAKDLLTLVNMPLGQAREMANAVFGDFADDVMAHRKEIRNLFEQRTQALEEAKTKGAEREKLHKEQYDAITKKIGEDTQKLWKSANETAHKDEKYGKYFVPIEGDEEGNIRLGKGFQLVDRAFSDPSPADPRLSPEERTQIVKRHAAVRNRAAAFGRLVAQNTKLTTELETLKKELEQYKASTPNTTTSTTTAPTNGQPVRARDRMLADLRKLAK